MKILSKKISYVDGADALQVIVRGKIDRWKEALLSAWMLAWIFIGIVVFLEYFYATNKEMKMILVIFLIFWSYYFFVVGRVWLFRLGGNELIRVSNGMLSLKRSYFTYGKAKNYSTEFMEDFKVIEFPQKSFTKAYETGWWVLGGEKLGFQYQSRFVKFGMQLNEQEALAVYKLLRNRLKKSTRA